MLSSSQLLGKTVKHLDEVDSTNSCVMAYLDENPFGNFLVTAKKQAKGRGQGSHSWDSEEGGIFFSVGFSTKDPDYLSLLPLLAGLSVRKVLQEACHISTQLKWVNDILYQGKKLGGVLVESKKREDLTQVVIGIGVNVSNTQETFIDRTSLNQITGQSYDIPHLTVQLVESLSSYYRLYAEDQFDTMVQEWELYTDSIGKKVLLKDQNLIGTVIGINSRGYLRVVTLEQEFLIYSTGSIEWQSYLV